MKKASKKTATTKNASFVSMRNLPVHFFLGDLMTSKFFNRYKFTILIIMGLLMFYIAIKYECRTRMETIAKLEKELAIVKSESVREQSSYRSRTRESSMTQLVDSMHLNLKIQDQPPYTLNYDEK